MRDRTLPAMLLVAFSAFMLGYLAGRGRAATPTTCVYRNGGALPSRRCTPGAWNPSVTQGDIHSTICMKGWTSIVRPPSYITDPQKRASMGQYGVGSLPTDTLEYDHLVPLELGGAVDDARNLWPEYYRLSVAGRDEGAYAKDRVEGALHAQVCAGTRSLRSARLAVARDWRKALD